MFRTNEIKQLQYELDEILPYFRVAVERKITKDYEDFLIKMQQDAASIGYFAALEQRRIKASSSGTYLGQM